MKTVYLDNNATTALAPEVYEASVAVLKDSFGNPSSAHTVGQRARYLLEHARQQVAACLNASTGEIVFTSGGTESDNLAIRGLLRHAGGKKHIVSSSVEHEAVARVLEALEPQGYEVTYLKVDRNGQLSCGELDAALREDTALVSIMLANNETGILLPIENIARICLQHGVPLHTDAVQAIGKVPLDVNALGVDLLSLSGHKFHGMKGAGALYVRKGLQLSAEIIGGFQEQGLRGGTENVPGVVALGAAASLARDELPQAGEAMRRLRDHMEQRITEYIAPVHVIGRDSPRLPNTSYLVFEGVRSEEIVVGLSEAGICVSGGSACHSGASQPSSALIRMGIEPAWAAAAVRISLSRYSTQADIDRLLAVLPPLVKKLKSNAAVPTT